VDPARYDAISVARFQVAMDAALAKPNARSARAVLRITREQMMARPGNQFANGYKGLIAMGVIVVLAWIALATVPGSLASDLRQRIPPFAPAVALGALGLMGFGGWRTARNDQGDREAILSSARSAWSVLKAHDDGTDDTYDRVRKLLDPPLPKRGS